MHLMFKFVWVGDDELRLYWDEDQYITSASGVTITDDDDVVEEACHALITHYFSEAV